MAIPVAPTRKRGNPIGASHSARSRTPDGIRTAARHLHLTKRMYSSSLELQPGVKQNRNRLYVPEWLLEEWGITVNIKLPAARRNPATTRSSESNSAKSPHPQAKAKRPGARKSETKPHENSKTNHAKIRDPAPVLNAACRWAMRRGCGSKEVGTDLVRVLRA